MNTITDQQVAALRAEAAQAGDLETVRLCDRVRNAYTSPARLRARRRVAEIIRAAQAMLGDAEQGANPPHRDKP